MFRAYGRAKACEGRVRPLAGLTLPRPGEVLAAARRVPGAAPAVTGEVDVDATLRTRDAFSSHWDDSGQVQWVLSAGTELVRGVGRLVDERAVEVEGADGSRRLRAPTGR